MCEVYCVWCCTPTCPIEGVVHIYACLIDMRSFHVYGGSRPCLFAATVKGRLQSLTLDASLHITMLQCELAFLWHILRQNRDGS